MIYNYDDGMDNGMMMCDGWGAGRGRDSGRGISSFLPAPPLTSPCPSKSSTLHHFYIDS